jgi:hypothetical protein
VKWLEKFVHENIGLILSNDNRNEALKMQRKDFFNKNSVGSGEFFTLKDVAIQTIKHLVSLSRIDSEETLRKFVNSSFFLKAYLSEYQMNAFTELIKPVSAGILKPSDLGKLEQDEYLLEKQEQIIGSLKADVERELELERQKAFEQMQREKVHLDELKKDIESKMDEMKNLESTIDDISSTANPEDYVAHSMDEETTPEKSATWWKKLGLTGDPFPTKLGLNGIPEEKYEKVVVTTQIFKNYLAMIDEDSRGFYGKTILITGQFGSGKTTFVKFISFKLANYKIIPFQLVLEPVGDIDSLRRSFYSDLFNSIGKVMKQHGFADPRSEAISIDKSTIAELLVLLSQKSQIDGYAVVIDGLHKAESTLLTSLEFVKQLQNFHEFLNDYNINVAIFVVVSPYWTRTITQDPAFGGSFYRIDEIPTLTFEDAYSLLQKRFNAFANPNIPIFFEKSAIQFAYDNVYKKLGYDTTFRSFIDYVIPKFVRGEFKDVGISVSVDLEDAQNIDNELTNSLLKDCYLYYKEFTKGKSILKRACTNILRYIYRRRFIGEKDVHFIQNKGGVIVLHNAHFIQKTKLASGGLGWRITTKFLSVLQDLNDQGFPPEVVFQTLSIDLATILKTDVQNDPVLNQAQTLLARREAEWPEIVNSLKSFIERHKKVVENQSAEINIDTYEECKNALTDLVECGKIIFKFNGTSEEWLRNTWIDIPILHVIIPLLEQNNIVEVDNVEFHQRYLQSAKVLLEKIEQVLEVTNVVNVISSSNRNEELRVLLSASNSLRAGEFDKAIEEINANIEKMIRVLFHLAFSLHFSSEYVSHMPEGFQKRVSEIPNRGIAGLKRPLDRNLFYHLSRSEYAEIVNTKNNWGLIFEKVFYPKTKEEIINALQLTFGLDDRKQHRDRVEYFRERKDKIRQAIFNADWLMSSLTHILDLAINPPGFVNELQGDNFVVRVSFLGSSQATSSYVWKIPLTKFEEIKNRVILMPRKLDFSEDNAIMTLFDCSIAEIFIVIAEMIHKKEVIVKKLPDGDLHLEILPCSIGKKPE